MIEEKNYPALMLISKIYKGLAYIAFLIGIIASVYVIVSISSFIVTVSVISMGTVIALCTILLCAFIGISFLAISELILLFINIEENTILMANKFGSLE